MYDVKITLTKKKYKRSKVIPYRLLSTHYRNNIGKIIDQLTFKDTFSLSLCYLVLDDAILYKEVLTISSIYIGRTDHPPLFLTLSDKGP